MNITTDAKKRIHFISGIIISVMLIATGVLFCFSCYAIYNSAESQMYTYESIGAAFSKISIPVWICVATVILGAILSFVFPVEKEKNKAHVPQSKILNRLYKRIDIEALPENTASEILWKRTVRRILYAATIAIYALRAAHSFIYILNTENFPQADITSEVAKAVLVVLLNLFIPFVIHIAVMFISDSLVKKELVLVKKAITDHGSIAPQKAETRNLISKTKAFFNKNDASAVLTVRVVFLTVGISFVIAGIMNGGANDVLTKAAEICAECIGLG